MERGGGGNSSAAIFQNDTFPRCEHLVWVLILSGKSLSFSVEPIQKEAEELAWWRQVKKILRPSAIPWFSRRQKKQRRKPRLFLSFSLTRKVSILDSWRHLASSSGSSSSPEAIQFPRNDIRCRRSLRLSKFNEWNQACFGLHSLALCGMQLPNNYFIKEFWLRLVFDSSCNSSPTLASGFTTWTRSNVQVRNLGQESEDVTASGFQPLPSDAGVAMGNGREEESSSWLLHLTNVGRSLFIYTQHGLITKGSLCIPHWLWSRSLHVLTSEKPYWISQPGGLKLWTRLILSPLRLCKPGSSGLDL